MAEPRYPLLSLSRLRMGIDGPGVTTLIAGAGCPLRCRWCINQRLLREAKPELVTARELFDRVRICFGGGESLLHADFIRAFRALCPADWKICAETSLAVDPALLRTAAEAVDLFVVDCKDMDAEIYRRYTGKDGALMRENLRLLLELAGPERVTVRVPLIPDFNTPEDQARSAEALQAMGVTKLELFSYIIKEE